MYSTYNLKYWLKCNVKQQFLWHTSIIINGFVFGRCKSSLCGQFWVIMPYGVHSAFCIKHLENRLWPHRASRKRERRIITASHVLCLSCIWIELNFLWIIPTMRSISLGEIGLVRLCSRNRFITCVVNSLQA